MNFFSYFSRITTPGRTFLPQVDGLRCVAIVAVIAYHVRMIGSYHLGVTLESGEGLEGFTNRLFEAGSNGVQLFFAISGFILALPFARQFLQGGTPVTLRGYFLRRLTRLEPPYIIQLAFFFLLSAFVLRRLPAHEHLYGQPDWAAYVGQHLLASLFYVNGFLFGTHPYPNFVLWSLETEVQFYILAPVLALLFKISAKRLRRALIIGGIVLSSTLLYAIPHGYRIGFTLAGNLQFFLIGFLVCDFYLTEWKPSDRGTYVWDGLFLLGVLAVVAFRRYSVSYLILPWSISLCLIGAFKGEFCRKLLSLPLVSLIGGMCYTIYMYHSIIISSLIRLTLRLQTHVFALDLWIQFLLMSVVIVGLCAPLFLLFERPFMKKDWPRRVWEGFFFR